MPAARRVLRRILRVPLLQGNVVTVVRAPGVSADGGIGIRGFRAHCPRCSFLGPSRDSYFAASAILRRHRCEPELRPPNTHSLDEHGRLMPL